MNGWETLERAANTSPRCDERPWEVSFASDQESRIEEGGPSLCGGAPRAMITGGLPLQLATGPD
jgi:hypothetical protein